MSYLAHQIVDLVTKHINRHPVDRDGAVKAIEDLLGPIVRINEDALNWINDFVLDGDLFRTSYCGYWAYRLDVSRDTNGKCVLLYEISDESIDYAELDHQPAIEAFNSGKPLPEGYHVLNREVGERAYFEGVKLWGLDWLDTVGDSNTYDTAIQHALLGEARYG